jgi:hypothetical protein
MKPFAPLTRGFLFFNIQESSLGTLETRILASIVLNSFPPTNADTELAKTIGSSRPHSLITSHSSLLISGIPAAMTTCQQVWYGL